MMKIATLLVFAAAFTSAATAQADTTANLGSFAYYGAHHKFSESKAARPPAPAPAPASVAPAGPANQTTVLIETNMDAAAGSTAPAAPGASDQAAAPADSAPAATPPGNTDAGAPPASADSGAFTASPLPPFGNDAGQAPAGTENTAASDALNVPDNSALLPASDNGSAPDGLGEAGQDGAVGAAAAIPEPATPALIGLALAGLALRRKALAKSKT